MALVCIPRSIGNKLKEALQGGDITLDKLYDMKSEDRHTFFEQYVGKEGASLANAKFDSAKLAGLKKSMVDYVSSSNKTEFARQAGKAEFAKSLQTDEQIKAEKVKKLDEAIAKNREMQSKVSEKLGEETDAEKKANL